GARLLHREDGVDELLDAVVVRIAEVDVPGRVDGHRARVGHLAAETAAGPCLAARGHGAQLEAGATAVHHVLPPAALPVALRVEPIDPLVRVVRDVDLPRA